MKTLLNLLQKTKPHQRRHPPKSTGGFTMIELLVGMIIAALIITPMLAFVVNILNRDVREQAKTNSEQELQAAIDYIAQDMSQALYVYDPSYAGDTTSDPPIPSYAAFAAQLPEPSDASQTWSPILVFWKRELVEDALAPSGGICANPGTDPCNDTFVLSLVAYYEITEANDGTESVWCQPSGGTCPKRIARFQIQDGVKDLSGSYVCDDDGDGDGLSAECDTNALRKLQRDLGFNDYSEEPTAWTKKSGETYNENNAIVLVNYIEGFRLDNPLVDTNGDGTTDTPLIEASGYKLAKIQIVGNALRRSQSDFSCEVTPATTPATYKNSPYCPKATARVGARSGFGE